MVLGSEGAPSQVNKENLLTQKQKSKNKTVFQSIIFSISMHFHITNPETLPKEHLVLPSMLLQTYSFEQHIHGNYERL